MDTSTSDSPAGPPGSRRSVISYVLLLVAFGVVVPRLKGLEFFDPQLLGAYACLGMVFSGPAAAQAFRNRPASIRDAVTSILWAAVFGELIAIAILGCGVLTVYLSHLRSLFFLPDLAQLAVFGALGAAGSLALAALAAWVALRFSMAAARAALRGVFLALLALFFLKGQNLSTVAGPAALIALALAGLFLLLIQMNLRRA